MNSQTSATIVDKDPSPRRVFVAFTQKTDLPFLRRFLPRGFRHCSVHINDGAAWISLEALAGYTEIFVHDVGADYDLPSYLRGQGMSVVETSLRRDAKARRMAIPAFYTCVEEVKRILGIHKPLILTPTQLHRHLTKEVR